MKGIIYAILATISYSSTPTFTQLGYKGGIQTNTLLFSRHLVSLIFMLPSILNKKTISSIDGKAIPWLLLFGLMSIIRNILFNYAYHYLSNMVSIAISISYIIMVFVIEMLLGREKYNRYKGMILIIYMFGLLIIAIPGFSGSMNMIAFTAGLLGSLQYAVYLIMMNSKYLKSVPTDIILLTDVVSVMLYSFVACIISGESLLPSNTLQWISIICLGTVGVILARGLFYKAVRLIGATQASMIDSMEPLSSAVLGWFLLGQGLNVYTVAGSALMIVSILMLLREKNTDEQ